MLVYNYIFIIFLIISVCYDYISLNTVNATRLLVCKHKFNLIKCIQVKQWTSTTIAVT
jgi:hypothetical protein